MKSFVLACAAAAAAAEVVGDINFTSLGKFYIKNSKNVTIAQWDDQNSTSDPFLLMKAGDRQYGSLTIVPGLKEAVVAGDLSTLEAFELDTEGFNYTCHHYKVAPASAFDGNRVISCEGLDSSGQMAGIFLWHVSSDDMTKTLGAYKITSDEQKYTYGGGGFWVDLNSDGIPDFITARYNNEGKYGELLWFERPKGSSGLDGQAWIEHRLI